MFKFSTMVKTLLFFLIFYSSILYGQTDYFDQDIEGTLQDFRHEILEENKTKFGITFGASVDFGNKRNGSIRGFLSVGLLRSLGSREFKCLFGAQSQLEIYRGGLGTSLENNEKFKLNIEWRNAIIAISGYERNNDPVSKPAFVSVLNDLSALYNPLDYSLSIGTCFINGINHSRHQQIGIGSISVLNVQLNYYNDATPFHKIGLADRFDRYWTGGGDLGVYWNNNSRFITDIQLSYVNYTGYQRNLYELAGIVHMDNLPYKDKSQQMFNQGAFIYKVGIKNQMHVNYSIFEPAYSDIQYLIHYNITESPFHPRPLGRRNTIGFDYINKTILP